MLRRIKAGSVAAVVIALVLAGCGSSAATPSPQASAAPSADAETNAPVATSTPAATTAATDSPSDAATGSTLVASCDGVGIRKTPATKGQLVVRVAAGTKVHVVATVPGDAYKASACGLAGDTWYKIDKVGSKTVKAKYGVTYGYAAAGFFE